MPLNTVWSILGCSYLPVKQVVLAAGHARDERLDYSARMALFVSSSYALLSLWGQFSLDVGVEALSSEGLVLMT